MKEKTQNRKAYYDYYIEEKVEAGIILEGWEVKAIREKAFSIKEAYAVVQKNEIVLIGLHINPGAVNSLSSHKSYDPLRTRKLLLNKKEIAHFIGASKEPGYSLLPLNIYFSGKYVKVEIGLGKGKKNHDKRESEKNKDWQRSKERLMKNK